MMMEVPSERQFGENIQIGDLLDVLDQVRRWCVGEVIQDCYQEEEEQRYLLVHYLGWSDKWNEWISTSSSRIAPYVLFG